MSFEKFEPHKYKKIEDVKYTLRIPNELHEEIASYATKHNVSINTLILNCIEYAMKNKKD